MKKRLVAYWMITLCLLCAMSGCGEEAETGEVVRAMCETQMGLPAGQMYDSGAVAGEAGYAEDEMLAAMYGSGELPPEFESVNHFSIRLCGFALPYEFAVFRCVSADDAYEVAQMCLRRAHHLRVSCRETEFEKVADGALVSVMGKYVLMAVGEDAASAMEAGRQAIRGGGR